MNLITVTSSRNSITRSRLEGCLDLEEIGLICILKYFFYLDTRHDVCDTIQLSADQVCYTLIGRTGSLAQRLALTVMSVLLLPIIARRRTDQNYKPNQTSQQVGAPLTRNT